MTERAYFLRFDFADGSSYTQRQDRIIWEESGASRTTGVWDAPFESMVAEDQVAAFAMAEGRAMVERHGSIVRVAAWYTVADDPESREPSPALRYLGDTYWEGERAMVFEDPDSQGYRVTWQTLLPEGGLSEVRVHLMESCPRLIFRP